MSTVLVTGGAGLVGREVVVRLGDEGHRVRVLTRSGRAPRGAVVFGGDVADGTGLAAAMAGVEVVVHAATDPRRSSAVDDRGTGNVIAAARRAGVSHLIYPSVVGAERSTMRYYRAKVAAERQVEAGEVPWTIFRFTQVHDCLAVTLDGLSRWPVMPVPSGFRLQPLETRVAARRLVELAGGAPSGRVAELGGPEDWESRNLASAYLRAGHKRRIVVPRPMPTGVSFPFRSGAHLATVRADNTRTWQMYLRQYFGGAPTGR
jgi:uncharacterized protein YbjT (DUF2867 family)